MIPLVNYLEADGKENKNNGVANIRSALRKQYLISSTEVYETGFFGGKSKTYTAAEYLDIYGNKYDEEIRSVNRVMIAVFIVGALIITVFVMSPQLLDSGDIAKGIASQRTPSASYELLEQKRMGAAMYIGALDGKKGVTQSIDTLKKAGLSDAEIRAYYAGNKP